MTNQQQRTATKTELDRLTAEFFMTPAGWKISAMAWDDERPGFSIPQRYTATERNAPASAGPSRPPRRLDPH